MSDCRFGVSPVNYPDPDYSQRTTNALMFHFSVSVIKTKIKYPRFMARESFTLHTTHCVHTSMNVREMKFISYIYTLSLHCFCTLQRISLDLANRTFGSHRPGEKFNVVC